MLFYGEDSLVIFLDKDSFRHSLAADLLQVRQFPIFNVFSDEEFQQLYKRMHVTLVRKPGHKIYDIGEKAESIFIVRQGMVSEQHEIPPKLS